MLSNHVSFSIKPVALIYEHHREPRSLVNRGTVILEHRFASSLHPLLVLFFYSQSHTETLQPSFWTRATQSRKGPGKHEISRVWTRDGQEPRDVLNLDRCAMRAHFSSCADLFPVIPCLRFHASQAGDQSLLLEASYTSTPMDPQHKPHETLSAIFGRHSSRITCQRPWDLV